MTGRSLATLILTVANFFWGADPLLANEAEATKAAEEKISQPSEELQLPGLALSWTPIMTVSGRFIGTYEHDLFGELAVTPLRRPRFEVWPNFVSDKNVIGRRIEIPVQPQAPISLNFEMQIHLKSESTGQPILAPPKRQFDQDGLAFSSFPSSAPPRLCEKN